VMLLSTLFVKQHYIADEIPGFFLAYIVSRLIVKKFWNPITRNVQTIVKT